MKHLNHSRDVLTRQVGDELVLMDLGSGRYFHLNRTGAVIWTLLSHGASLEFTIDQLCEKFGVDTKTATADIESLVRELEAAGLVTIAD